MQLDVFAPAAPLTDTQLIAHILVGQDVTSAEQAAVVRARIAELWAVAEQRYEAMERPLRYLGCSYRVADSGQTHNRAAWLSAEEAAQVHRLALAESLFSNDPRLAHERIMQRLAIRRQQREQQPYALAA